MNQLEKGLETLCRFLKSVFLTALFRYDLHAIKLTHLKYTIR